MAYKTRLGGEAGGNFQQMMDQGFGIITVMNAKVFDAPSTDILKAMTAYEIVEKYDAESYKTTTPAENDAIYRCYIDTFKVANVTIEGPSKTITGGQYTNPLIKFGKTARLEMQDALGRSESIEALCGGIQEWSVTKDGEQKDVEELVGLHFGSDFVGPKMLIGDSFFMDRKSGQQVPVKIVFYQFLPDAIFNLTQDSEGDATVFDMNGDLLVTNIKVARNDTTQTHGVFYSIVDPNHTPVKED